MNLTPPSLEVIFGIIEEFKEAHAPIYHIEEGGYLFNNEPNETDFTVTSMRHQTLFEYDPTIVKSVNFRHEPTDIEFKCEHWQEGTSEGVNLYIAKTTHNLLVYSTQRMHNNPVENRIIAKTTRFFKEQGAFYCG